jgi:hypothetical protein
MFYDVMLKSKCISNSRLLFRLSVMSDWPLHLGMKIAVRLYEWFYIQVLVSFAGDELANVYQLHASCTLLSF